MDPRTEYTQRRARFEALRAREARRSTRLSAARLASFLLAVGCGVAAELRPGPLFVVLGIAFFVAFIGLLFVHDAVRRHERRYTQLRDLNEEGIARLDRAWDALPERAAPVPDEHGVAADLDLFGRPSLLQLLGPVGTPRGRVTLGRWLLDGAPPEEVRARQEAVAELAGAPDLREALAAHGRAAGDVRAADIESFLDWAEGPPTLRGQAWLRVLSFLLPALTFGLLALGLADVVPGSLWVLPVTIAIALTAAAPGKAIRASFARAFGREGMFHGYPGMFETVAGFEPRSERLRALRHALGAGDTSAAVLFRRIARLMHLADLRHSGATYAFAQFLLLWDFHVARAIDAWQREAGGHIRDWLRLLGEIEALSALATLAHDEPDWVFPDVTAEAPRAFRADSLGHPMLPPERRVDNDVAVGPAGRFLLVTGSNMSGKSTLLRAIGLNTALGLAGAPVCARSAHLPYVVLRTSIHVHDSLIQGISYFMAQLRRLKDIVSAADAAEPGRPALYLLDEILAGTNTAERRVAATRVIRHLVDVGAIGAVTTHDLGLAEEAVLADAADAVHFTERVDDADDGVRMNFDYRLRPGVATSTNALRLMRAVGLEP